MFSRVARYKVDPNRCEEALTAFRHAAGEIGDLEGLEGGYVLVDREAGRIYTMTLWSDMAAMEASEVRASRLRHDALGAVDGDCESVESLDVASEIGSSASLRDPA